MPHLPESALPELRARWLKLAGAREVTQHAIAATQAMEAEYTTALNMILRMLEIDPAGNWRIDLETGEITEAEATAQGQGVNGLSASAPVSG